MPSDVVNGFYVGTKIGSPTQDKLTPADDGYDTVRSFTRLGTPTGDALEESEEG